VAGVVTENSMVARKLPAEAAGPSSIDLGDCLAEL
jgi:hypothetical protein